MNDLSKAIHKVSKIFNSMKVDLSASEENNKPNRLEERKIMLTAQEETHLFLEKLLFQIKVCEDIIIDTGDISKISDKLYSMQNSVSGYMRRVNTLDPQFYKNFLFTTLSVLESSIEEQIESIELDTQLNLTSINEMRKALSNVEKVTTKECNDTTDKTED